MENDDFKEPKKKSLVKELFLTGLTIATLGFGSHHINKDIEKQDLESKRQNEISQRESNGLIKPIETPFASEEQNQTNYHAEKFLFYNQKNINPNLILERIKGKYEELLYIDKQGIKTLKLGELNPQLTKDTIQFSQNYDVNPKLMLTLAIIESKFGFDKNKSSAGAKGPFQVMPKILKHYKKKNKPQNLLIESAFLLIIDYSKTLRIDISYNSKLTSKEITLITAAYNAGITNLRNNSSKVFIEKDWFRETKNYSLFALSALNNYNYDTGIKDKHGNNLIV